MYCCLKNSTKQAVDFGLYFTPSTFHGFHFDPYTLKFAIIISHSHLRKTPTLLTNCTASLKNNIFVSLDRGFNFSSPVSSKYEQVYIIILLRVMLTSTFRAMINNSF